jgi:hypothetical protein
MKHNEAVAIDIYYRAIEHSHDNNIELRENKDTPFYKNTTLTKKKYLYIYDYMYFDDKNEVLIKEIIMKIICDYLRKLEDVHTGIVCIREEGNNGIC